MIYSDFKHRYALIAAEAAKNSDEKVASKGITDFLCNGGQLNDDEFKMGTTKMFFKSGVLARLENLRDQALRSIVTKLQSHIQSFLGLTDRKRRVQQKSGTLFTFFELSFEKA